MTSTVQESGSAGCRSEYGTLKRVVLCPPRHMAIKDIINDVQKKYATDNINTKLAMKQHANFVRALNEQGTETVLLEPHPDYPEQVFTRDIGFTVGDEVFVSEMACSIRQGEEKELQKWLQTDNIPYRRMSGRRMEGGDVIVDRDSVFVGISSRTGREAVHQLKKHVPDHQVIPIHFAENYLHLDCVFNVISEDEALIFPEAMSEETVDFLAERYHLIHVSKEEQFTLGTNVLSIGDRRIFSLPQNPQVNTALRKRGYEVIEIDLSEIIKSGGSFRCCTMPIERGS
ncbi:dimethylarginine dimethylaminohydrolase family protein [Indiicoccus explosivorum]|uniref:dimethylarginine dimethylaminohydrolase family protein n=1 Tax=Indiicoccus explosivorum TaxID=1917864 RepID=UPI000B454A62|nr:arginine deiminase family protein [Indiicoccus explosivorum]